MSATGTSATDRLAVWLKRTRESLLNLTLEPLESKVFRDALVTVLLISAFQQFVGWKYIGVVVREVAARVQEQVLPWSGVNSVDHSLAPPEKEVVALLIGDEFFADKEGFGHRVPLPPDKVRQLLQAVIERLPQRARIFVDFDLAPRVGEDQEQRKTLDDWLGRNAERLLLVEPSWASRHVETLGRQLDWSWRMCRLGPYHPSGGSERGAAGAVFVQSTLVSSFGFVLDSVPLSGKHGPAWDVGRAVADQLATDGLRRNPLCGRLQGDPPESGAGEAPPEMTPITLQLMLGKELQRFGALQIAPQPLNSKGRDPNVLLRSEYISEHPTCQPTSFDDIATLACLREADIVVIGGSWSYGFSDRLDTFVGEADGAVVQAAWIQSWLKPARPLNKLLVILFNVVVIETLLHPILQFAFGGMRRGSNEHNAHINSGVAQEGLGLHVATVVGYLGLAAVAFVGTAFAMIVIDGLLRWTFDRSLSLDTTILTLLAWSAVELNGSATNKKDEPFPVANASWLAGLCVLSVGTVFAAFCLSRVQPSAASALIWIALVGAPVCFLVRAVVKPVRRSKEERDAHAKSLDERRKNLFKRLSALRGSVGLSLHGARTPRPARSQPIGSRMKHLSVRLADAFGTLLWLCIYAYGLWVLASSALWSVVL
jgi:hypothetical protein